MIGGIGGDAGEGALAGYPPEDHRRLREQGLMSRGATLVGDTIVAAEAGFVDEPVLLVAEPGMTRGRVIKRTRELLMALAPAVPDDPEAPIRDSYPVEPGVFRDLWPALTCWYSGFSRPRGEGFDEVRLPTRLTFQIRGYYPVIDGDTPGYDGLVVAQEKSVEAISAFLDALDLDPHLGRRVRWAGSVAGRSRATEGAGESVLIAQEADVEVRLH